MKPRTLRIMAVLLFILILSLPIFFPNIFSFLNKKADYNETYYAQLEDIDGKNWETRPFNVSDFDYGRMKSAEIDFLSQGKGNFSLYLNKRLVFNGNLSYSNKIYLDKARILGGENMLYFYNADELMHLKEIKIKLIHN
jgi:hypothetical protein